jgi:pimeloyl-ACP methyl ester carboxylesterase
LFLHGYLETKKVWENFIDRFTDSYRVIAIDLPGHGDSDSFSPVNSMEIFAESIKGLADSLNIRKFFLAGHSMGGYAVMAFLEHYPEYLTGYSLFHSHPFADPSAAIEKRKINIGIVESGKKDEMIPGFIENLYSPVNRSILRDKIENSVSIASGIRAETIIADLKGMMERPDRSALIAESSIHFLWILGRMDSHINADDVIQKVKLSGNSRVVVLENSGHMGFIEEPEQAEKHIKDFIGKL